MAGSVSAEDLYRMRNFSTSGKRIINKGDSILSRSNLSINQIGSREEVQGGMRRNSRAVSEYSINQSSLYNSNEEETDVKLGTDHDVIHRVLMLGSTDVGKSAICSQVLSSEHANTYDTVESSVEKEVIISVDDEESTIVFVDHPAGDMEVEDLIESYSPVSCFLVVMAVDDDTSMFEAKAVLTYLTEEGLCKGRAIILVANKTDLVRNRIVSIEDGQALARRHGVKYIETSPGINHNIDELLVGVIKQVRLRRGKKERKKKTKMMKFLGAVLKIQTDKTKSCTNLSTL